MSYNALIQGFASSGGVWSMGTTPASTTTTAANEDSGNITFQINGRDDGSFASVINNINSSNAIDALIYGVNGVINNVGGGAIGRIYYAGFFNLTSTGNTFVAAPGVTFPITGVEMGQTQNLSFIPFVQITTATPNAHAHFTFNYVDQEGVSTTGTFETILPKSSQIGSCFILRPNDPGQTVQSITAIDVNTSVATGGGTVYLLELLSMGQNVSESASLYDCLVGSGLRASGLAQGTATSGNVSSQIVTLNFNNTAVISQYLLCSF